MTFCKSEIVPSRPVVKNIYFEVILCLDAVRHRPKLRSPHIFDGQKNCLLVLLIIHINSIHGIVTAKSDGNGGTRR